MGKAPILLYQLYTSERVEFVERKQMSQNREITGILKMVGKMNNIHKFYIQHQNVIRETMALVGIVFFCVMFAWGLTKLAIWAGTVVSDRDAARGKFYGKVTMQEDGKKVAMTRLCQVDKRACLIMRSR